MDITQLQNEIEEPFLKMLKNKHDATSTFELMEMEIWMNKDKEKAIKIKYAQSFLKPIVRNIIFKYNDKRKLYLSSSDIPSYSMMKEAAVNIFCRFTGCSLLEADIYFVGSLNFYQSSDDLYNRFK